MYDDQHVPEERAFTAFFGVWWNVNLRRYPQNASELFRTVCFTLNIARG
jgi:hypothetical protein